MTNIHSYSIIYDDNNNDSYNIAIFRQESRTFVLHRRPGKRSGQHYYVITITIIIIIIFDDNNCYSLIADSSDKGSHGRQTKSNRESKVTLQILSTESREKYRCAEISAS